MQVGRGAGLSVEGINTSIAPYDVEIHQSSVPDTSPPPASPSPSPPHG